MNFSPDILQSNNYKSFVERFWSKLAAIELINLNRLHYLLILFKGRSHPKKKCEISHFFFRVRPSFIEMFETDMDGTITGT